MGQSIITELVSRKRARNETLNFQEKGVHWPRISPDAYRRTAVADLEDILIYQHDEG